jgi:LysR family transcriptional activator of nhaA
MPAFLNYHHLRYFRVIAGELSVTRAAAKLNLSASAVSIQLRQLEESLGQTLFERGRGGLRLTEAGRVVLDYATTIGRAGEELMDVMANRAPGAAQQVLRVGAVATLSRNFQLEFLKPALHRRSTEVIIRSGAQRDLLVALHAHEVDLVLSNSPARRDAETCSPSNPCVWWGCPRVKRNGCASRRIFAACRSSCRVWRATRGRPLTG